MQEKLEKIISYNFFAMYARRKIDARRLMKYYGEKTKVR